MRLCCTLVLIFLIATPAIAQPDRPSGHRAVAPPALIISDRAIAMGIAATPPPAMQSRDSLVNGAIIGAVVGGVAMGAFGGWLCHMLKEPGEPTCWRSVAIVGVYGAAIGAAGGAGIDALVSIEFRTPRQIQRPR